MYHLPLSDSPSPDWLTVVLRYAGQLLEGRVVAVEARGSGAFNSNTSFLRLTYSNEAPRSAPLNLVLKRNIPDSWSVEAGAVEVSFYNLVASRPGHPQVTVPCYAASYDPVSGDSYLLLQDISATHAVPVTRDQQIGIVDGVPAQAAIDAVVDTLARLHAYWWNQTRRNLDTVAYGYWNRDTERFGLYLQRRSAGWASLRAEESAWLPGETIALYEQVIAKLPGYWNMYLKDRFLSGHNLTLVHGDAYFANFMCPLQPRTTPAYLLDWQSPCFDIGAYDLVNLLATFWTSAQRAEGGREEHILRRYHTVLQENGVAGYLWDDLQRDYQHGIIFWLLMPVQDRFGGSGPDYWWPKMQCLTAAFLDWNCAELL
jgi:hypothetical protein